MRKEDFVKIAIWGTGPAGLLAAHAASLNGHEFRCFGLGVKSELFGAQYLHKEIPGIPDIPRLMLTHEFRGDIDGYRRKVYDELYVDTVSPQTYTGTQLAYDIRYAYNWLFKQYWSSLVEHPIRPGSLMGMDRSDPWSMVRWNHEYDMVISTIPRKRICVNPEHKFVDSRIWALGEAPEKGITSPIQPGQDNILICSGSEADSWYRLSRIFERTTVEWPGNRSKPPIRGIAEVFKPVSTTCECWPEVLKLGRFGQWKKAVLTHDVFDVMMELLG